MLKPMAETVFPLIETYMEAFRECLEEIPETPLGFHISPERKTILRQAAEMTERPLPDLCAIRQNLPCWCGEKDPEQAAKQMHAILNACEQVLLSAFTLYLQESARLLTKYGYRRPPVVSLRHFLRFRPGTRWNYFHNINNAFTTYMDARPGYDIPADICIHIRCTLLRCKDTLEAVHGMPERKDTI